MIDNTICCPKCGGHLTGVSGERDEDGVGWTDFVYCKNTKCATHGYDAADASQGIWTPVVTLYPAIVVKEEE